MINYTSIANERQAMKYLVQFQKSGISCNFIRHPESWRTISAVSVNDAVYKLIDKIESALVALKIDDIRVFVGKKESFNLYDDGTPIQMVSRRVVVQKGRARIWEPMKNQHNES